MNTLCLCGYGVGGLIASGFWKLPRRLLEAPVHGIHLHSLVLTFYFQFRLRVSLVLKVSVSIVTHVFDYMKNNEPGHCHYFECHIYEIRQNGCESGMKVPST
jgi:hypothetical protein